MGRRRRKSYSTMLVPLVFPLDTAAHVFQLARYGLRPRTICRHVDHPLTGGPLDISILTEVFGAELKAGARQGAEETAKALHDYIVGNGVKRNARVAKFRAQRDDFIGMGPAPRWSKKIR